MRLSDFDFDLPEDLITTRPARPRSSARLLLAQGDGIEDRVVDQLDQILQPGDRLVLNDTKVIPARLSGKRWRDSGQGRVSAGIEVTLLEPGQDGTWSALAKPLRKLAEGEEIVFSPTLCARVVRIQDGQVHLAFDAQGEAFEAALEATGAMPLPPYIAAKRPADAADKSDYQTVWANRSGAVAAPTASLHFDEELLAALARRGVDFSHVTLHVGAGTFLPVKVDDIRDHKMHAERGQLTARAVAEIAETKARGGRVICVGTTSLRLVESAWLAHGRLAPFSGDTDLFITPGFTFHVADMLLTNFHLPKSTLLMLVSAFSGQAFMREAYAYAVENKYRFFSYGDACLLRRREEG